MGIPRLMRAYLVCATPRSGSTLLCEMLRETGRAGRRLEHFEILRHSILPRQPREYFGELPRPELLELLAHPRESDGPQPGDRGSWWARILRDGKRSEWGLGRQADVGPCRMTWLLDARGSPGLADADLEDVLHRLLDDPQLIFVTRRRQGCSSRVAVASASDPELACRVRPSSAEGRWSTTSTGIDHLVWQLESDERAWRECLLRSGPAPRGGDLRPARQAPRRDGGHGAARAGAPERGGHRSLTACPPAR